jgi:hypothetical protein
LGASEISALAAWAAAIVALTGVGFQFFVGRKQANAALTSANASLMNTQNAGRHKVAESRQAWINKVIDTLSEHHSIASTIPAGQSPNPADDRKLASLRTRLAILLNPEEADTIVLLNAIGKIDESRTDQRRRRQKCSPPRAVC